MFVNVITRGSQAGKYFGNLIENFIKDRDVLNLIHILRNNI